MKTDVDDPQPSIRSNMGNPVKEKDKGTNHKVKATTREWPTESTKQDMKDLTD